MSKPSRRYLYLALAAVIVVGVTSLTSYESFSSVYDAEYVGSRKCGECHTQIYREWAKSPHAKMARPATPESVVGDFDKHEWRIPPSHRRGSGDALPVARMERVGDRYFMSFRDFRGGDAFHRFPIDYVIGYQYRQTYVTREPGGVLRRLPLQWSVERGEFFPYWNMQENSRISLTDLWDQFTRATRNSAWNMFCARCHVTNLRVLEKDANHTKGKTEWVETGIGCEACHGPGSHHVHYFATNYVNRVAAFLNSKFRAQPVAYIANAPKLDKGQDVSVCARCHGPDIQMADTEAYREYEPGYSKEGKINDLTPFMTKVELQPNRRAPTIETWADAEPKGIGMLLRSFIDSACWKGARTSCYDCHDPHDNKRPRREGMLEAGPASDSYCLKCHDHLAGKIAEHTHHEPATSGSHCYDCHMPHKIQNLVGGFEKWTRTHSMSSIPMPENTEKFGMAGAPNACNECHKDKSAAWATEKKRAWWPPK